MVNRKDGPGPEEMERIAELIREYSGREWALIPLLQAIQASVGYIPGECIRPVAHALGLFPAQVHGVITFYRRFTSKPRGRVHVRVCRGLSCRVRGGRQVLRVVSRELGIGEGEKTPEGAFSLESASCLGICLHSPAMTVGRDYHGLLTSGRIASLIRKQKEGNRT
jgi:NADH:ubiquinone oxidoreductase subunit E